MALLTANERALLSQYSTENQAVQLGQRLADASTLQFYGDSATAHVRLAALPLAGDTLTLLAGSAVDRLGLWDQGCSATYEFTTSGTVAAGNVPVLIGATPAATATALAAAMQGTTTNAVVAEAHPVDTTTVDLTHNTPGAVLTLATTAPAARIVAQNNSEQLPLGEYVFIIRKRTITAEDVARGRIRFDTGWSQIVEGFASLYRSSTDQTPENYNGTTTMTAGVLELTQGTAAGTWAAGSVIQMILLGIR